MPDVEFFKAVVYKHLKFFIELKKELDWLDTEYALAEGAFEGEDYDTALHQDLYFNVICSMQIMVNTLLEDSDIKRIIEEQKLNT